VLAKTGDKELDDNRADRLLNPMLLRANGRLGIGACWKNQPAQAVKP
jgi:hypothetical protein